MTVDFEAVRIELANLLMVSPEELYDDVELDRFENWDSLTKVTLVAFLVDKTGGEIDVESLERVQTVSSIRQVLIGPKK